MRRLPPRSTQSRSSAASDVYKRQAEYVNLCEEQTKKIGKVETYKGQRAIPIQREVFYAYVGPLDYQEELHEGEGG